MISALQDERNPLLQSWSKVVGKRTSVARRGKQLQLLMELLTVNEITDMNAQIATAVEQQEQ